MENESSTCGVCSILYDSNDYTPRVLINCGHTLCSSCLVKTLNTPDSRKCPFDDLAFSEAQNSLEHFPPNFALLALLEGKNKKTCPTHGEELTLFCLQDEVKICSDCVSFGKHEGHSVEKIKGLKAKGIKAKEDLEEVLVKFEKNQFEKGPNVETLKNRCLSKMELKFGEINKILKTKHVEWLKQVENLFESSMDSSLGIAKISKAIEEIDQAFQTEENLGILDQDFSSILSRLEPQAVKEQTARTMNCIESFLTNQAETLKKTLEAFDLSNDRIQLEQPVLKEEVQQPQLSSENVIEIEQKSVFFKRLLTFKIRKEFLNIWVENRNLADQMIDLDELKKARSIKIKLELYDSLFQDSANLTALSEILQQLNHYNCLTISFAPDGLTDQHALDLLNLLFCRIQYLKGLEISFKQCKITDEPILLFCTNILPKAVSLKYLILKLGSTSITDKSLFALAESLSPFSKSLKEFLLGVGNTGITDEGIEKIFGVVKEVRGLHLYLKGTGITDRSLMRLGELVMPCMEKLKKFRLRANQTKITMEGVSAIFDGIPNDINELMLYFEEVNLPDEVISLFEEKVCPKLGLVESVDLGLEGKDLRVKASRIVERVRKEAAERRKADQLKKGK